MRLSTLLLLVAAPLLAQESKPAFEVVSIKPASETIMQVIAAGQKPLAIDDAQAAFHAVPLSMLIQFAYQLPQDQVVAPSWIEQARFHIVAKLPPGSSKAQVPAMLQTMLADRFHLASHHEEKTRAVYLLTVGKGGPKMKPAAGGDPAQDGCQGGRGGHHTCRNVTMEAFAEFLSHGRTPGASSVWLDRPVVNRTGLAGAYDFPLDFGCVGVEGRVGCGPEQMVSLIDAVKTLGLTLESAKAPFDILIVDRIDRAPSEN